MTKSSEARDRGQCETVERDLPPGPAELLHEALKAARAAHLVLQEAARAYEDHRCQLFRNALERSGQAWCSWRQHAVPRNDVLLVAINGLHRAIHWICKDCLIAALQDETKLIEIRRESDGYVSLATGERLQGQEWGDGASSDFSNPSGVPHAAAEAFGLPLKITVIRTEGGYGIHAGVDDPSDRYRPY